MAKATLPAMESRPLFEGDDSPVAVDDLISSLQDQPESSVYSSAEAIFHKLLEEASRPKSSTSSACTNLLGFVQKSTKSSCGAVRTWAFRENTALRLLNFYIEWNEKDQQRSMKLVLNLLNLLINQNPSKITSESIKSKVLDTLLSIIGRHSTRPLAKSSISSLNYLLKKSVCTLDDIASTYRIINPYTAQASHLCLWTQLAQDMFSWMHLPDICPIAGKFLVTIVIYLRMLNANNDVDTSHNHFSTETLRQWLLDGLSTYPSILESIKTYIFVPLFKSDRATSLELLKKLNIDRQANYGDGDNLDNAALLQLAALEVGKRSGLVGDSHFSPSGKPYTGFVLDETVLDGVLGCQSAAIRSLAISLVTSSASTTLQYSESVFTVLRKHLPIYHSDTDAKFRSEVLGHSKRMISRLKGAITALRKNISQGRTASQDAITNDREVLFDLEQPNKRSNTQHGPLDSSSLQEALDQHESFLQWYVDFLRNELMPTASYQRHITALKAATPVLLLSKELTGLSDTFDFEAGNLIFGDYGWIRAVFDCIMDAFNDVREFSTSLLMICPEEIATTRITICEDKHSTSLIEMLQEFCGRAEKHSSRTGRADHADGAARAKGLLCRWTAGLDSRTVILSSILDALEEKLELAENDLGRAAIHYPVHGDFASIRYIWIVLTETKLSSSELESLVHLQVRILQCCQRIWQTVRHVLCDDSPEGHLPEEMEDIEGLETRDLLSYAFRATIDSSNAMRAIISSSRSSRATGMLYPSRRAFSMIGSLTFEQLSTLRHRGAFSTVAQTFTTCCQFAEDPMLSSPRTSEAESLLSSWYKATLDCIHSQASTTRRSAGIPALMTGILAANSSNPSFEEALLKLEEIASTPVGVSETYGPKFPQVHALNCIRGVFRSSLLSKRAEPYLPQYLRLAADSLKSPVWAIRNCGLILLRSLIDCLFGSSKNKAESDEGWDGLTTRISFTKYPTLPSVLLSLLKSGLDSVDVESQQRAAESVFPALDIIRRAGPPEAYHDELYACSVQYLGSHLWHVREVAARTVCSFLIRGHLGQGIGDLFKFTEGSSNRFHGKLLAAKYVLERSIELKLDDLDDRIRQLREVLSDVAPRLYAFEDCSELWAAYLDVWNLMTKTAWTLDGRQSTAKEHINPEDKGQLPLQIETQKQRNPCSALLQIQLSIRNLLRAVIWEDVHSIQQILKQVVSSDLDTATRMLETLSEVMNIKASWSMKMTMCTVYINICTNTNAPEFRVATLLNLAELMYQLLDNKQDILPQKDNMLRLWQSLQQGEISPTLSRSILRISGPIMAGINLKTTGGNKTSLERDLRAWSAMLVSAGQAENTFDTRYAAVLAVRTFAKAIRKECTSTMFMPVIITLYDNLIDDDDEIRDIAAQATGFILGNSLVPVLAAESLLSWMSIHFGSVEEFKLQMACRMVGHSDFVTGCGEGALQWAPAVFQLQRAMKFDNSLFAVEEQNLFLDEVRETERWAGVFESIQHQDGESFLQVLLSWVTEGLGALIQLVSMDDGPLGWTSKPAVFAICARILGSARALHTAGYGEGIGQLLSEVYKTGRKSRIHGLLLSMAEVREQRTVCAADLN